MGVLVYGLGEKVLLWRALEGVGVFVEGACVFDFCFIFIFPFDCGDFLEIWI
jgi:hypothetical protein